MLQRRVNCDLNRHRFNSIDPARLVWRHSVRNACLAEAIASRPRYIAFGGAWLAGGGGGGTVLPAG